MKSEEDLLVLGLAGVVVFLFMRQQSQAAVQTGPTTPQGTSYPSTIPPVPSTSQSTPASVLLPQSVVLLPHVASYPVPGAPSYIDPNTGKTVVCPAGQVVVDVGDLAPSWTCGALHAGPTGGYLIG